MQTEEGGSDDDGEEIQTSAEVRQDGTGDAKQVYARSRVIAVIDLVI